MDARHQYSGEALARKRFTRGIHRILACTWTLAMAVVYLAAGCTASETAAPATEAQTAAGDPAETASVNPGGPIVSPFMDLQVTGVEVRQLAMKPVQVEAVIRGTVPDQCAYRFYAVENRQERSVRIQIKAIHPANADCAQTTQAVEYIFPLGRDMPEAQRGFAPGEYELVVNDYRTTFFVKE